jgi:hypothetical protein
MFPFLVQTKVSNLLKNVVNLYRMKNLRLKFLNSIHNWTVPSEPGSPRTGFYPPNKRNEAYNKVRLTIKSEQRYT